MIIGENMKEDIYSKECKLATAVAKKLGDLKNVTTFDDNPRAGLTAVDGVARAFIGVEDGHRDEMLCAALKVIDEHYTAYEITITNSNQLLVIYFAYDCSELNGEEIYVG